MRLEPQTLSIDWLEVEEEEEEEERKNTVRGLHLLPRYFHFNECLCSKQ